MSQDSVTSGDATEQKQYQVTVWASKEVSSLLKADSEDEAKELVREEAVREHPIARKDLSNAQARETDHDREYSASVWGDAEYVETVEAESVSDAEEKAAEFVVFEYGIASKDVKSTNATEVGY